MKGGGASRTNRLSTEKRWCKPLATQLHLLRRSYNTPLTPFPPSVRAPPEVHGGGGGGEAPISQFPKFPWLLESLSPPHEAHPQYLSELGHSPRYYHKPQSARSMGRNNALGRKHDVGTLFDSPHKNLTVDHFIPSETSMSFFEAANPFVRARLETQGTVARCGKRWRAGRNV